MIPSPHTWTAACADGLEVWGASNVPGALGPTDVVLGETVYLMQFGADAPWSFPEAMRDMRARLTPIGHVAVWKTQNSGRCIAMHRDGRSEMLGVVHGESAVGVLPDGRIIYLAAGGLTLVVLDPFGSGVLGPTPLVLRPGTSQGFTVNDDGALSWVDITLHDPFDANGVPMTRWVQSGDWIVGQLSTDSAGLDGVGAWHVGERVLRVVYDGASVIGPQVTALPDGSCLAALSLPGLIVPSATFKPLIIAQPTVPSFVAFSRALYVALGDQSAEPEWNEEGTAIRYAYGYTKAPGNAEVLWRPADLARRRAPDRPFLAVRPVVEGCERGDPRVAALRGLVCHVGGATLDGAGRADIEATRLRAVELGVPCYVYRDHGGSIRADLYLPVDGFLLQCYPSTGESDSAAGARIERNLDEAGAMVVGFVVALYTQGGNWPVSAVLNRDAHAVALARITPSIQWLTFWPWLAPTGRGGPLEHDEFRVMASRVAAAAVHGAPPVVLQQPEPEPPSSGTTTPPAEPSPVSHIPEGVVMTEVGPVGLKYNGRFLRLDPKPESGKSGDAQFPVRADRDSIGPHEMVDLFKDGDRFVARFRASGRVLTITDDGRLESRADAGSDPGNWEHLMALASPSALTDYPDLLFRRGVSTALEIVKAA